MQDKIRIEGCIVLVGVVSWLFFPATWLVISWVTEPANHLISVDYVKSSVAFFFVCVGWSSFYI